MQNKFILCAIILLFTFSGFAQQLPLNTCGIVHTYDASGNRLKRVYFCNNGIDPYPTRVSQTTSITEEVQLIDALYPNPTTGKFSVTFSKPLKNAEVFITDVSGKVVQHFKAGGNKVDFNLSSEAAGTYFMKINDAGNIIMKKVVKQ
ncbi:MAG TPA: T9SS type A sorting domain-containing protein [Chitinophagaceae bacterium]|nr:T9SS type A sorting domain-containing protein [Chitinophagaceae bacterium]